MSSYLGVEIKQYLTMVSDFKSTHWLICDLTMFPEKFVWLVVMFFRFVTAGEIRKRSEFFEPFIVGLTNGANGTVEQVCSAMNCFNLLYIVIVIFCCHCF